jgi:CBS domain-containing protein
MALGDRREITYQNAQDSCSPSRRDDRRIVELCNDRHDAEDGRKQQQAGIFFDRNRLQGAGARRQTMAEKLEPPLVGDLMITNVFTVSPDMTLEEAVVLLVKRKIPLAPVVIKKDGLMELIGIISEKDCIEYLSNEFSYGTPDTTVKNMMEQFPLCVPPETDILSMATVFSKYPHKHLPVVKNKNLVGIISRRDVLEGLLEFHKSVTGQKAKEKSPLDYHQLANLRFILK